jgi:hypothetical protein
MRRSSTRPWWALAAVGPLCFACNGILGIEERTLSEEQTLAPLSCATYCEEALASCSGEFAIYASTDVCMEVCEALPLGADTDPSGNTVACRLEQARLAKQSQEFSFYCPAAGPGGDGVCGENCQGYCDLMLDICPSVFEDSAECLADCEGVPSVGLYHVPTPEENTIQCRLYHLTSATLDSVHCEHASGELKCVE